MGSVGVSVGAALVGNLVGDAVASGDVRRSKDAANRAYAELAAIGLPPDISKRVILEQFQAAGILDPDLEKHIKMGESQQAKVEADPKLKEDQMSALEIIKQTGKVGLTAEDRARVNETRKQLAQDAESKRQQILQQMQMRGMGGSGAELAMQIAESQASANRGSEEADRLAAEASKRALEATIRSGEMAGQIRTQQYGEDLNRAKAADELNRFNIENQRKIQERNIASANQAEYRNLMNRQSAMDANTNLANQEALRQNQAKMDVWKATRDARKDRADQEFKRAQGYADAAGRKRSLITGGIGAALEAGGGASGVADSLSNIFSSPAKQQPTSYKTPSYLKDLEESETPDREYAGNSRYGGSTMVK